MAYGWLCEHTSLSTSEFSSYLKPPFFLTWVEMEAKVKGLKYN